MRFLVQADAAFSSVPFIQWVVKNVRGARHCARMLRAGTVPLGRRAELQRTWEERRIQLRMRMLGGERLLSRI